MNIISIRETPTYAEKAMSYFPAKWPSVPAVIYHDSIKHSLTTPNPLPQWYLLEKDEEIIGCAGMITNDFISRMDLYPWICALYIEEKHRGKEYSTLLIEKAKTDAARAGFDNVYLCTDHIGFYEKYGFEYLGQGYHPWDEESRIYGISIRGILDKPIFSIRPETPEDYPEVYNLIRKAFKTANVMDGDEQDYALNLRESKKYIPQLALVAESDGKLIGHIMFTHFPVVQPDGTHFDALLVAPLSVLLEYRNKGIGSALMHEGFRIATQMGFRAAFLAGDPNYYSRFGYRQTSDYGIVNINGIPDQFIMVKELQPDTLNDVSGTIDLH